MQAPFRNVLIGKWDPHCTKTDGLLFEGNATTLIVLIDVGCTILDQPEQAGARRGSSLVVKDSHKKAIVPVSVQHCVVRVGVVFVTVEVVDAAKMVHLHVGPD